MSTLICKKNPILGSPSCSFRNFWTRMIFFGILGALKFGKIRVHQCFISNLTLFAKIPRAPRPIGVDGALSQRLDSLGEKYVLQAISSTRIDQYDKDLIRTIQKHFLIPPSMLPYNLESTKNPSMGQGQLMELLFGNEVSAMCTVIVATRYEDTEIHSICFFFFFFFPTSLDFLLRWALLMVKPAPILSG